MAERIVIVNPPRHRQVTRRPSYTSEPHLGLAYVTASLRQAGFDVRYLDGEAQGLDAEQTAAAALEHDPLYIGLTAPTALIKSAAKVAEAIKRRDPARPVAIGGYHATVLPERTLHEFAAFDYAVFGEGEITSVELARRLTAGQPVDDLGGIVWRDGATVVKNGPGRCLADLDELPLPAWDLFPLDGYQAHYRTDNRVLELPVNMGRGCRGRCKVCARVTGDRVRRRSAENILAEIRRNVEEFGAGAIVFMDETFAANSRVVAEMCEGLIREGLHEKIYWLCQTRVDSVDRDILRMMARAGCRHIAYGIESASPDILRSIGKGTDRTQIEAAVRWAREAGILVDNFFILGLPGETPQTIRRTIRFAIDLDSDFANFFILVPYPGTEIYEMAKRGENGLRLLTHDWDLFGIQMGKALELSNLPRARLEWYQFLAYLRFYVRPSKLGNMLRMVNYKVVPVYFWNMLTGWLRKKPALGDAHESA